jgi:hypothetical protein
MTHADLNAERLALSERLVDAWEALLFPGIEPLDLSRLAAQEIAFLTEHSKADPKRAEALIGRLKDLVQRTNRSSTGGS